MERPTETGNPRPASAWPSWPLLYFAAPVCYWRGPPATVLAALRKQVAETGANYIVGQFAFGDMTTEETLASLDLFTRRVMPELRG